jgi:hypothetical protein
MWDLNETRCFLLSTIILDSHFLKLFLRLKRLDKQRDPSRQ